MNQKHMDFISFIMHRGFRVESGGSVCQDESEWGGGGSGENVKGENFRHLLNLM